jgi:predicted O-methyltransferase YrrM
MTLEELLARAPKFHSHHGHPWSWQLASEALSFIDTHVDAGMVTLETGAGVSTVLFAARGARHTAIAPAAEEFLRIRRFCAENGVSLDDVTLLDAKSEAVLPALDMGALDLVLIDGSHAFPAPFVDWLYTAGSLKVGGHLVVDDIQLWTGHVLRRFLEEEPGWVLRHAHAGRFAVFVKSRPFTGLPEWTEQPFVTKRSKSLQAVSRARRAVDLVRRGELRDLLHKTLARQR